MRRDPADLFGQKLREEFSVRANAAAFKEIPQFRALQDAIQASSGPFAVEELHGTRSHVRFSGSFPWTVSPACCELSDMCIVWFKSAPPQARMTLLQAKRSHKKHSLCHPSQTALLEDFYGDSTQWYLLSQRPAIRGRHACFCPPTDLLSGAFLPSIGSFGVFHELPSGKKSFFFVSAAKIAGPSTKGSHKQLTAMAPKPIEVIAGFKEQQWTCCAYTFGYALYSGLIGTPIHPMPAIVPSGVPRGREVIEWLAASATSLTHGDLGPVARSFFAQFDVALPQPARRQAPARSIVFLRANDDDYRDQ